jgi:5-methylcytosine-specific restriction protein B
MPSKPITSVTEFARVLRDDIIPLLEEYCYDDFGTLRNILGDSLVDIENQRIREELFTANKEEALILAVSFEEMQPLLLTQETGSDALGAELPEDTSNDGEDSSHSAS